MKNIFKKSVASVVSAIAFLSAKLVSAQMVYASPDIMRRNLNNSVNGAGGDMGWGIIAVVVVIFLLAIVGLVDVIRMVVRFFRKKK